MPEANTDLAPHSSVQKAPGWPGSTWSGTMLRDLLRVCGVEAINDRELLAAARQKSHKLIATALGAFARERELSQEEATELAAYQGRFSYYQKMLEKLSALAPGIQPIKGLNIARYYPTGLIRAAADLDLHCAPEQLWKISTLLSVQGWGLSGITLLRKENRIEIFVVFARPSDDSIEAPYEIELKTVRFDGDPEPEALSPPTVIDTLVALLVERTEQKFRSRDYLDLALLLHELTPSDIPQLRKALDATDRWPEWQEAGTQLARLGWLPPHAATLTEMNRATRIRLARKAKRLTERLHPLRAGYHFSQWTMEADRGPIPDRIATLFHERGGVARAFHNGLQLFGVPINNDSANELVISRRGPHLVAVTPLGSFLLVASAAREEWLTQAQNQ